MYIMTGAADPIFFWLLNNSLNYYGEDIDLYVRRSRHFSFHKMDNSQNDEDCDSVSFTGALLNVIHEHEMRSTARDKRPTQRALNKTLTHLVEAMKGGLKRSEGTDISSLCKEINYFHLWNMLESVKRTNTQTQMRHLIPVGTALSQSVSQSRHNSYLQASILSTHRAAFRDYIPQ